MDAATILPVIAVTGLAFEARIAAGAGVTAVCGDGEHIAAILRSVPPDRASGIISFGTAGGLAPDLEPGRWIVATAIVTDKGRFRTDPVWSRKLMERLPDAAYAELAAIDEPVLDPPAKRDLRERTGATAVDTESHFAASVAAARNLPFAACRVIIDPVHRTLPEAALAGLRQDRTTDVAAVLRSLMARPGQFPDLVRLGTEAWVARRALLRGRRLLGAGLGFPDFSELVLDVP